MEIRKKQIVYIIVGIFTLVLGVLATFFTVVLEKKQVIAQKVQRLPEFALEDLEGQTFSDQDIDPNQWTVFVFFNSQCHFCQEEATQLSDLGQKLQETNFLWISSESTEKIQAFSTGYDLSGSRNSIFLQDVNGKLAASLNISARPQFLVYAPDGSLTENHKGAWRIDKLLEQIDHEFQTP